MFLAGLVLPRELLAVEVAKRLGNSVVGVHSKISHFGLEDDKGAWCVSSSSSSLSLSVEKVEVLGVSLFCV